MHKSLESLLENTVGNPRRATPQPSGGDERAQYACQGVDSDDKTAKRHRETNPGEAGVWRGCFHRHGGGGLSVGAAGVRGNPGFRGLHGHDFQRVPGGQRQRLGSRRFAGRAAAGLASRAARARRGGRCATGRCAAATRQHLGQLESQPKEQGDECLDVHDDIWRPQPSRLFQESKTKLAEAGQGPRTTRKIPWRRAMDGYRGGRTDNGFPHRHGDAFSHAHEHDR